MNNKLLPLNTDTLNKITGCIHWIDSYAHGREGKLIEGLFRVRPDDSDLNQLKIEFNDIQCSASIEPAIHVLRTFMNEWLHNDVDNMSQCVSSLLKYMLRELEVPLIPWDFATEILSDDIFKLFKSQSPGITGAYLAQEIVLRLAAHHFYYDTGLLSYIIQVIAKLFSCLCTVSKTKELKMPASNLYVPFLPSLCGSRDPTLALEEGRELGMLQGGGGGGGGSGGPDSKSRLEVLIMFGRRIYGWVYEALPSLEPGLREIKEQIAPKMRKRDRFKRFLKRAAHPIHGLDPQEERRLKELDAPRVVRTFEEVLSVPQGDGMNGNGNASGGGVGAGASMGSGTRAQNIINNARLSFSARSRDAFGGSTSSIGSLSAGYSTGGVNDNEEYTASGSRRKSLLSIKNAESRAVTNVDPALDGNQLSSLSSHYGRSRGVTFDDEDRPPGAVPMIHIRGDRDDWADFDIATMGPGGGALIRVPTGGFDVFPKIPQSLSPSPPLFDRGNNNNYNEDDDFLDQMVSNQNVSSTRNLGRIEMWHDAPFMNASFNSSRGPKGSVSRNTSNEIYRNISNERKSTQEILKLANTGRNLLIEVTSSVDDDLDRGVSLSNEYDML